MAKSYSIEQALQEIGKDLESLSKEIQAELKMTVAAVSAQCHSFIVQRATDKLKSTRQTYLDALEIKKVDSSPDQEAWAITLDNSAGFLEDGKEAYNAVFGLTHGPKSKVGKDGKRYNIIPFEHSKAPSQQSLAQNRLGEMVKQQLKTMGLDKTIKNNGNPVLGKAWSGDLKSGMVSKKGYDYLAGTTIYQKDIGKSKPRIARDVMTFRIVKEGSTGWNMPDREGLHAFKEAEDNLERIWTQLVKNIVR